MDIATYECDKRAAVLLCLVWNSTLCEWRGPNTSIVLRLLHHGVQTDLIAHQISAQNGSRRAASELSALRTVWLPLTFSSSFLHTIMSGTGTREFLIVQVSLESRQSRVLLLMNLIFFFLTTPAYYLYHFCTISIIMGVCILVFLSY